jgi:hypothetical protein
MERLVRTVFFCGLMLASTLTFAQQLNVTAGNHGRCEASWELDSPPMHSVDSPWGTVALGKSGWDSTREWKGSTASGIGVTVFPEGKYGKGTLVRFAFAVCQRVTADDKGTEIAYIVTPKPTLLRPGYWYLEPKGSYAVEMNGNELALSAFATGHGLDVKLLPAQAPAPAPNGRKLKSGPDKWKFEVVMTCKEGKCVTPAGIAVRDTLP